MGWFKKHKVLTVIGIVVLIAIISSSSSDKKSSNNTAKDNSAKTSEAKADTKAQLAKIGEVANDGKFAFTVKSVKCGQPSVTDSSGYLTKTAQGQYCLVTLSVKNTGDKQQYFSEGDQKLLNAANQQFSADASATLTNAGSSDVFLAQINPGNSVEGVLVFDLPKDQTPVTAELHDSALSGGVKVSLQ